MTVARIFLLAWLLQLQKSSWSLDCPSMPQFHTGPCICDPRLSSDKTGGWEMTCFDDDMYIHAAFIIDYAVNKRVSIECATVTSPYTLAMYSRFNVTEINTFEFRSCLLPTISFGKVLKGQKIYSLTFESRQNITDLTPEHFGNLKDLNVLIFKRNDLSILPHNLFINLTNLQYLGLNENRLQKIDEDVFSGLSNLTDLELGGNLIEELPEKIFSHLHNLKRLYLYKNKLRSLSADIFHTLQSLAILEVSSNQLEELPASLFERLKGIERISLRGNRLMIIPANLFHSNTQLSELDLSNNFQLEFLPELVFLGLSKLENASINNCNISSIHPNLFVSLTNLHTLKLNNNRIKQLPSQLFQKNPKLKILLLDFNYLETLPADLFELQYSLTKLCLSNNNLQTLPSSVFRSLVKLSILNLSSNNFTDFDLNLFKSLQLLKTLDLSDNKLQRISNFGLSRNLRKVDVSRNRLSSMPGINWSIYLQIQEINFEHNNIKHLNVPVLLSDMVTIRLGWNNISRIDIGDLMLIYNANKLSEPDPSLQRIIPKNSPRFYLFPNPIQCDCQTYRFVSYITGKEEQYTDLPPLAVFPFSQNLTCNLPEHLIGKKLTALSVSDFVCPIIEDCPSPCSCYRTAQSVQLIVNCSYSGMEHLPSTAPWNTSVLDFSGNHLRNLDSLNEPFWQNLTEIHLEGNYLNSFGSWNFRQNLIYLSLRENVLHYLPIEFMNYTSGLPKLQLSLGYNRWTCNCSTMDMKAWLTENYQKVSDINSVYCENEVEQNGTISRVNLVRVSDEVLCPPDKWPQKRQLIIACCIGITLALLLCVTLIMYYRNRTTVMAYLYFHFNFIFFCLYNEEELDEDKMFDAFVSYSSNDRDVMLALLNELEKKDPPFKLCIHERDWMPGNFISLNIANSVQYSKRTILVLTKDFLESVWFQVEFQTAYHQMLEDKINRLIVILKGDLPPKDSMDKNLQVILSTKTYLVWGERWFWEKLRYAMPHKKKPLQEVPNQIALSSKITNPDLLKSVEDKMSSFICIPESRIDDQKVRKGSPNMSSSTNTVGTDSGVYSIDSVSSEYIISESGMV